VLIRVLGNNLTRVLTVRRLPNTFQGGATVSSETSRGQVLKTTEIQSLLQKGAISPQAQKSVSGSQAEWSNETCHQYEATQSHTTSRWRVSQPYGNGGLNGKGGSERY